MKGKMLKGLLRDKTPLHPAYFSLRKNTKESMGAKHQLIPHWGEGDKTNILIWETFICLVI